MYFEYADIVQITSTCLFKSDSVRQSARGKRLRANPTNLAYVVSGESYNENNTQNSGKEIGWEGFAREEHQQNSFLARITL